MLTGTDLELESFEELTADLVPPCESAYHGKGLPESRHHEGPAEWFQVGPCSHTTGFRCDKYVQYNLARQAREGDCFVWTCGLCKAWSAPGRYIRIN